MTHNDLAACNFAELVKDGGGDKKAWTRGSSFLDCLNSDTIKDLAKPRHLVNPWIREAS